MAIRIDQINVKDLGPIKDLNLKLGPLNLIYGKNECGKTLLVEFIISCLFSDSKSEWKLRDVAANGKIYVTGIEDTPVSFSPRQSSKKLEHHLSQTQVGIPANLSRLLVVKGAELELRSDVRDGIDHQILRGYLSDDKLLESIEGKIPLTTRKARIEQSEIIGENRGELKGYTGSKEGLERLRKLFDEVDRKYSAGERFRLENKQTEIDAEIQSQEHAKRYLAKQTKDKITELTRQLELIPMGTIHELRELNSSLKTIRETLQSLEGKKTASKVNSENYEWLKAANEIYTSAIDKTVPKHLSVIQKLALVCLGFTVLMVLLSLAPTDYIVLTLMLALFFGITAGILFVTAIVKGQQHEANYKAQSEVRLIASEYKKRFGQTLDSSVTLKAKLEQLRETHIQHETLKKSFDDEDKKFHATRQNIQSKFNSLGIQIEGDGPWDTEIASLDSEHQRIDDEVQRLKELLSGLNLDPGDYTDIDNGTEYRREHLQNLLQQKEEVKSALQEADQALDDLKARIIRETYSDFSLSWPELIQVLRTRWAESVAEHKLLTAKIVGDILISNSIMELREKEDQKILSVLDSDIITEPLHALTTRYTHLSLKDDNLQVSNSTEDFLLSQLSTGTKEQVLLALRLGIATKVLAGDQLFLILDDAFQHADWDRRNAMADEMIRLVRAGWQVISFTMDDQVRDMFNEKGKAAFEDQMVFWEL